AVTLTVSLLISLFVSLSLTPMLCARLLKPKPPVSQRPHPLYQLIENQLNRLLAAYGRGLAWVMRHQKLTLLSLLLTVLLNVFLFVVVQKGFFPNQDTGLLMGALRADQNISFQAMKPKMQLFTQIIQADPPAESVMSSMGSGMLASRNSAHFSVRLKDFAQRAPTATEVPYRPLRQTR
ncbi:MAG TPA: multidrug transporter subunit MdtC, partial [Pantoea agglomerans]|nr:multidrug transporter subunit MdtC [Pantoea agglomerans]